MANYAVVDWHTSGTLAEVLAAIETKLETLDSTTNPIRLLDMELEGHRWHAVMIYDG